MTGEGYLVVYGFGRLFHVEVPADESVPPEEQEKYRERTLWWRVERETYTDKRYC